MTKPTFFATPAEWRGWLDENHGREAALWVGLRKTGSDKPGITYREALDEALCFGWIDGTRKSLDAKSWMICFTPRKRRSHWSKANIKRMGELEAEGRLADAGRHAFLARDPGKENEYSFENREAVLLPNTKPSSGATRKPGRGSRPCRAPIAIQRSGG